jgi:hypothetical protein
MRPGLATTGSSVDVQRAQALQPVRRQRGRGDVGQFAGQVADLPLRVDEGGLLGALGAISHEFHGAASGAPWGEAAAGRFGGASVAPAAVDDLLRCRW